MLIFALENFMWTLASRTSAAPAEFGSPMSGRSVTGCSGLRAWKFIRPGSLIFVVAQFHSGEVSAAHRAGSHDSKKVLGASRVALTSS